MIKKTLKGTMGELAMSDRIVSERMQWACGNLETASVCRFGNLPLYYSDLLQSDLGQNVWVGGCVRVRVRVAIETFLSRGDWFTDCLHAIDLLFACHVWFSVCPYLSHLL